MREIIMMLTYETRALMAYTSVNKSPTALKGIVRALLAGKDILAVAHTFKFFRSCNQCHAKIFSFDLFHVQKFARS